MKLKLKPSGVWMPLTLLLLAGIAVIGPFRPSGSASGDDSPDAACLGGGPSVPAPGKRKLAAVTTPSEAAGEAPLMRDADTRPPDAMVAARVPRHAVETQVAPAQPSNNPRTLLEFVATREPPEGTAYSEFLAMKDQALRRLTRESPPTDALLGSLVAIAEDATLDPSTREYVLQHMTLQWFAQMNPPQQRKVSSMAERLVEESGNPVSGTALLAMVRLHRDHGVFTESDLRRQATRLASDLDAARTSRGTALAVCADRGYEEALPAAAYALRTEPAQSPLFLAASRLVKQSEGWDQPEQKPGLGAISL